MVLFSFLSCAVAKVYESYISDSRDWIFLDRFVYDTAGGGTLSYTIQSAVSSTDSVLNSSSQGSACFQNVSSTPNTLALCFQPSISAFNLLFYNDIDGSAASWFSVYNDERLTCDERMSRAATAITLDEGIVNQNFVTVTPSAVPHFWYAVLSRCGSQTGLQAYVHLHFLNSEVRFRRLPRRCSAAHPAPHTGVGLRVQPKRVQLRRAGRA